jgi:hypothetical protein
MGNLELGRILPVHAGRRIVYEIVAHARRVPTVTATRTFAIPEVVAQRQHLPISWVALFAKSYGIAAKIIPELRQQWINYPFARIYEHPFSACTVIVEREWKGNLVVLFGKVRAPENLALPEIDRLIEHYRDAPVWEITHFRQMLRLARLPRFFRWFTFWSTLNWTGFKRCKRFGTFTISSLGSLGAELRSPLVPLTGYLTFGPISDAGHVVVSLTFDHRVVDGRHAARALQEIERALKEEVLQEMQGLTINLSGASGT